jgi:hypothetical protein
MRQQPPPSGDPGELSDEELRAAYEAELQRIRVEDVIAQTVVSLLNLGGRRAGLVPGAEGERDLAQVRLAIEGARALLPLVQDLLGRDAGTLRDALSQLQMAYAQLAGQAAAPGGAAGAGSGAPDEPGAGGGGEGAAQAPPEAERPRPGEPGPAQRSGRLWIPGQ